MPYKRENSPYWWASYTNASGRRVRCSTDTESYAEAKAIESRLKAESFEARQREESGTSFAAVMLEYLNVRDKERELVIVRTLRDHFGDMDMSALKPANVTQYVDKRRMEGRSDSTIGRELAVLSAAINRYSYEHGIVLPNPVKGRKPKQSEGRIRWISKEESERLIAASGDTKTECLPDFIRIGLNTGCRKQELLGLEWSRVDLGQRLIMLQAEHTKTSKRRYIPINETTRLALLSRWNWTRKHCPGTDWVFCDRQGNRLGNVRKSFLSACDRAGIADFHIHDLRHTCAAWLVTGGAPLVAVRDLLGHTTITTTEIYAHLAPTVVRSAVGLLDGGHTVGHTGLTSCN